MGMNKDKTTSGSPAGVGGSAVSDPNSTATTYVSPTDSSRKDNGLDAAVNRLKGTTAAPGTTPAPEQPKAYKPRDFDEEARGKTRCVMYAAALGSMAIAGMKWSNTDELKKFIREMADDGVKYSFKD